MISNIVPKISRIGIVLVASFIATVLTTRLGLSLLSRFFDMEKFLPLSLGLSITTIAIVILNYVTNIILAVWTYREAKKQNEHAWIWCALTLFFGLIAVAVFYLQLVVVELRLLREDIRSSRDDKA